mmetsp:Transcript_64561/g.145610  ORF Transcript_64561/g.145610 Transcript_64561/m.145610 type:complete len:212 (-) Transcript_64561:215-850(-)
MLSTISCRCMNRAYFSSTTILSHGGCITFGPLDFLGRGGGDAVTSPAAASAAGAAAASPSPSASPPAWSLASPPASPPVSPSPAPPSWPTLLALRGALNSMTGPSIPYVLTKKRNCHLVSARQSGPDRRYGIKVPSFWRSLRLEMGPGCLSPCATKAFHSPTQVVWTTKTLSPGLKSESGEAFSCWKCLDTSSNSSAPSWSTKRYWARSMP